MRQIGRRVSKLSLALLLAGGGLIAMGLQTQPPAQAAPAHTSHVASIGGPTWYGAGSTAWMVEATIGIWPQQASNACGVDTAIGVVNYDALNSGASMPQPASSHPESTIRAQNAQYPYHMAQTVSQWGYAHDNWNNTGGYTNIAGDFGTDPRSVAYMAWNYSINNRWFHDYVYRWQFSGDNGNSVPGQALDATTLMARGLEAFGEPVVAFINSGSHAVLVTGVYSYTDPNLSFPAQFDGLSIRDPEGTPSYTSSSDTSHFMVTISDWTTSGGYNGLGWHYDLWKYYYGHDNSQDPDPEVGVYKGAAHGGSNHWYTGFTWVQRDNNTGSTGSNTPGEWDPDWAFNGYSGQLMWTP